MSEQKQEDEAIKVVIRVRPLNSSETKQNCRITWKMDGENNSITLLDNSNKLVLTKQFVFDNIWQPEHSTDHIYMTNVHPIVSSVVHGFNGIKLHISNISQILSNYPKQITQFKQPKNQTTQKSNNTKIK